MTTIADIHLTLVGIERYGEGIGGLDGPAQQVVDYARWAITEHQAAPEEVVAFLSDPDGHDRDAGRELIELGVPEANIRPATFEIIRSYCLRDLPIRSPSRLLWLWSGHGYLYRKSSERVLYCADTSVRDLRVWSVTNILQYLRSGDIDNLDRQLVLFDVCAEGTSRQLDLYTLPTPPRFKSSLYSGRFFQDSISAAAEEEYVRTGEFSSIALRLLRADRSTTWPPVELAKQLKAEVPSSYELAYGRDSEPGDELEQPEIQRSLRADLEARKVIAIVGGHGRSPDCSDQTKIAEAIATADEVGYPFPDPYILSQVAEYVARRGADYEPLEKLEVALKSVPDQGILATAESNRLRLLARLPIKVYLTTAYDSLLERALELENRPPTVMSYTPNVSQLPTDEGTVERPIVFHLYGRVWPPDPMGVDPAVTEFDIYQRNRLLANDGDEEFFPPQVRQRLRDRHLYVGFSLRDRTLRGLLHALRDAQGQRCIGYAIQPEFEVAEGADTAAARAFVDRYLEQIGPCKEVRVLWDFPKQLVDALSQVRADVHR